jgi:hypothetical protein
LNVEGNERTTKKRNVQHRTLNGKNEDQMKLNSGATRGASACSARATSLFDVGRSMFDVQFVLNGGRNACDFIH